MIVGKVQAQEQPRKQQTHRKINVRFDWSDSDDDKGSQARGKPFVYDITSDQEADTDQEHIAIAPLRRPNTWPKVLTCGKGRGKFPLANLTSLTKGCGCGHNSGHDISEAPPLLSNQEPIAGRNLAVVVPTDRVQTYQGDLAPSKSRKDLANWTWDRLGNTRAKHTNNNRTEQRQWQRPDDNTANRTLDETEDHPDSESVEGDTMHSDASEGRPWKS